MTTKDSGDGKYIIVENGQRSSGLMSEEDARKEATKRQPANESKGNSDKTKVEVKQNLFG